MQGETIMVTPTTSAEATSSALGYINWPAIISGALAATAVSFILYTFAAGLGLAIASPTPSWRDGSVALGLLSGIFILMTTAASFGFGGYVTGLLRSPWTASTEHEFRDGFHGLLMWALAVAMGAFLAAATAAALASRSAPAAMVPNTTTGEPIIAYDLDRLFRSEKPVPAAEMSYSRAEASRIALAASGRPGMRPEDRTHLARVVAGRTGIAAAEAERRVDEFIGASSRAIKRARRSVILVAFMTATGLLLGAAVAWIGAAMGGSHRDGTPFSLTWSLRPTARSRVAPQVS
jgi:hypothetical protein